VIAARGMEEARQRRLKGLIAAAAAGARIPPLRRPD
jgi:hypothetical protein